MNAENGPVCACRSVTGSKQLGAKLSLAMCTNVVLLVNKLSCQIVREGVLVF